jgi:hypothetical protein
MYSFVFLWTMSMSPNKESIKHGLIFVNFMTASMVGSFLAGAAGRAERAGACTGARRHGRAACLDRGPPTAAISRAHAWRRQ